MLMLQFLITTLAKYTVKKVTWTRLWIITNEHWKLKKEQLGPNHVDVALSYNNIGLVYSKKGDLDQALDNYQRAQEIKEKQQGPNHVDVADSYNNIGEVYSKKGDLDQAMDYYQRALEIKEKQLGPNHVDVALSYNNVHWPSIQ